MPIQNAEIASLLSQEAELLEIQGANPFRVRAYRRAAQTIDALPRSVSSILAAGEDLTSLPGIGQDLAGKIVEIVRTGHFAALDDLKREVPGELAAIAALPGMGPKRVNQLHHELSVQTLDDLRRVVEQGRLHGLKGFGARIEETLRTALAKPPAETRFKLSSVEHEVDALTSFLNPIVGDGRIIAAGSYRRRKDTVGDLDLLATSNDAAAVGARLIAYENVARVLAQGPSRTTIVLRSGLQVDLRVVADASYGAALMYFTGSKAHNIALRKLANDRGWKLSEYGLFEGERVLAGDSEEEIYRKLGLSFVPPELREDRGEIALAREDALPKLITLADIRGDLHVHTTWSDGSASIEEMVQAARARGYEYLAITDHSQRLTVAHGLDAGRLARQIHEIDRVNARLHGLTLLKGVEVDILEDCALDLPDRILSRLDLVVAAVHSHFELSREAQTRRIVRAMDNPHVS
ncbi:MAG TPA: helix-hairpin-helix domain-containing protein, partial [Roseiarcus sp.]|nr:helix-hairpin-helix domain-containing protein [Roseiarcus sp.]